MPKNVAKEVTDVAISHNASAMCYFDTVVTTYRRASWASSFIVMGVVSFSHVGELDV